MAQQNSYKVGPRLGGFGGRLTEAFRRTGRAQKYESWLNLIGSLVMQRRHYLYGALLALFSLILFPFMLTAQSQQGQLIGTIKDSTGALVPGVQITLTNVATGVIRTTASNDAGAYTVPLLDPGKYEIVAKKDGFRPITQSGLEVHVNQTLRVDVALEVGTLAESIQITGAPTALQTATSDLGAVVENRQVLGLPLNGRNTIALAALAAGIRPQGTFGSNPATVNYTGWGNFSANGGLSNANEVLVDGTPATTAAINGVVMMPPVDATEEFKVQTNNFSAEFDRTAGGVINLSLKSGTNTIHGTAYEFLRNDALDATDFFINRGGARKPVLRYNQFGASFGGPIRKDKTFIFGLYEGFRQSLGRVYTTTVPTSLEQAGDFSNTRNAAGALRVIYDPLTTRRTPDGKGYLRDPFPANQLPGDRINPVSANLAKYIWPATNARGAAFSNLNNFSTSSPQTTDQDNFTIKVDQHFTENHRLSGSYSYMYPKLSGWDPLGNKTTPADDGAFNLERTQYVTINDSYVINPTTILDIRGSYMRFKDERIPMSFGVDLTQFGFPKSFNDSIVWHHIPNIHVSGLADLNASTGSTIFGIQNNYSLGGSLSLIRGGHSLKLGTLYRVLQNNRTQSNNASGDFSFNDGFTRADPLTTSLTAGLPFASFLLGYPASGSVLNVDRLALQSRYIGWYVQDDWRISSKLTLNIGFRYSIEPYITERFNRLATFNADVVPTKAAEYTGLPLKGGLQFMTPNDRSPANTFFKEFAPRFGFAYTLTSKTVLRGGYGIFWLPNNLAITNGNGSNPAYSVSTPFNASVDGGITPADRFNNPFPNGLLKPPGNVAGADTLIGQGLGVYFRETRPGYMQQWNFDIQQDVGKGLAVDVAYAGSKGTALPHGLAFNQLPNELWMSMRVALNDPMPNSFRGFVTTGSLSNPTITRQQTLLPFPQFTGVSSSIQPIGNSTYHSLQMKVTQRFASAGMLAAAYTLSKSITDTESLTGWLEPGGQAGGYIDAYNRRLDKSLANFDATHRLVMSYNYELPLGQGKPVLSSATGIAGKFVSGWQVNGITTFQSGFPVSVGRPNVIGDPNTPTGFDDRLYRWYNTAAFAAVPAYTRATAPRVLPATRSAGQANFDFSLIKNTAITERINLQFRSEFFNIFNHPWFGRPDASFGNPSFGTVNYVLNSPRQIQFGLKLIY